MSTNASVVDGRRLLARLAVSLSPPLDSPSFADVPSCGGGARGDTCGETGSVKYAAESKSTLGCAICWSPKKQLNQEVSGA